MTRRLTILALFLTTWVGLGTLEIGNNPMLGGMGLASVSLALLLAFVAGDFVERLGVPALTGYVITGIILGPVTNMLDSALLWDLMPLEQTALALLAFGAGAQLDLRSTTRLARPSIGSGLLTAIVTILAVGGVASVTHPAHLPMDGSSGLAPTLALMLGILAVGTSPAVVGWVSSAAERPGELVTLGLATTLVRATILVVAASSALVIFDVAPSDGLRTLAVSPVAALGIALAFRLAAPRLDRRAALPILVLLGLCVPALQTLGVEPVLSLAFAGLLTRHWTPDARRTAFEEGLADLRLPGALILFTLLGASLSPPSTALTLFVATLFITRAGALWFGNAVAGRWSTATSSFRANGWLILLPQGGLTLSVLGVLESLAPHVAAELRSPTEALVALSLMLGPIAMRVALRRAGEQAGEVTETSGVQPDDVDLMLASEPSHPWRDPMAALAGPDDEGPRAAWGASVQGLVLLRSRVREQVVGVRLDRIAKAHKASATIARQIVQNAAEAAGRGDDAEGRRRTLHEARSHVAEAVRNELTPLLTETTESNEETPGLIELLALEMEPIVRAAPTLLEATETNRHISLAADDPRWVRVGKLSKRLVRTTQRFLGRAKPMREIPYRRLVRRALAGEMLATLGPVEAMVSRAEYKALRRLETHVTHVDSLLVEAANREDEDSNALKQWLLERVTDLREASKDAQADISFLAEEPLHRVSEAMAKGLNRLAYMTDIAGTFALTENAIRYATVAPRVREAITVAAEDRLAWQDRKSAQLERTLLDLRLAELQVGLRDLVLGRALGPAVRMHDRVQTLMVKAHEMVQNARNNVASGATPATASAEAQAVETLLNELQRRVGRPLEGLINGLRSGGVIDRLIGALETATADLPEKSFLLPEPSILALERGHSTDETPLQVAVQRIARTFFDRRVALSLAEHSRALETSAEEARASIRDAQRLLSVHIARAAAANENGVRAAAANENGANDGENKAAESDGADGVHRLTLEALETVLERMEHEVAQTSETSGALMVEIAQTEADAVRELWTLLHSVAMKPQLDQAVWGIWQAIRDRSSQLFEHRRIRNLRRFMAAIRQRVRATKRVVEARSNTALRGPARVREALRRLDPAQREMPYVYSKLFALTPTENDAFVLGRDRELSALKERVDGQQQGAALVVGERGSGRSSLVRVALAETGRERTVLWLDAERALQGHDEVITWAARALGMGEAESTLATVTAEFRQRAPVVVLDGLETLFSRSAAGLEALDALMALIVATDRHSLWLVTCERQMWRLLTAITPFDDAFDITVDLRPLATAALREAIERRHRLSGIETTYARPRGFDLRAWFTHLWGTSPADRFFRRLSETSRGNPRTAMQLWQLGLTHHENGVRAVEIAGNTSASLNELRTLPDHLSPALGMIFRQGMVDEASMEIGLGWSDTEVRAALHALEVAGLLQGRTRADGELGWSLMPHACEPVHLFLTERGLLDRRRRLS